MLHRKSQRGCIEQKDVAFILALFSDDDARRQRKFTYMEQPTGIHYPRIIHTNIEILAKQKLSPWTPQMHSSMYSTVGKCIVTAARIRLDDEPLHGLCCIASESIYSLTHLNRFIIHVRATPILCGMHAAYNKNGRDGLWWWALMPSPMLRWIIDKCIPQSRYIWIWSYSKLNILVMYAI